jgi:menaquinone-specific isochorismate synthase
MSVVVHTSVIQDARHPLQLPPETDPEQFIFLSSDAAVIGWGVAARIDVGTGVDRFVRAREGLRAFAGNSALLAFASFTFDPSDDSSVMVVPRVVVRRQNGVTWRTTVSTNGAPDLPADVDILAGSPSSTTDGPIVDRPRHAGSTLRDDAWLDAVAAALLSIERGDYEKVVLARDLKLWSRAPFDINRVVRDLHARFPSCATFLVDHLVGASPEQLLRRTGRTITSQVLAGTAPRGVGVAEDGRLGAALLDSPKDRREHELALNSAVTSLREVCVELDVPTAPSLVRLDNVQHLGSSLTGVLASDLPTDSPSGGGADGIPHILDLIARLHPTAAVGGAPRLAALSAIAALEGMTRGRYAGPVGWCTTDGDGEFAIALRCAEVHGDRARLFAGAGVVAGSLPEAELTETWLKLQAMTGVLGA